MVEGPPAGSLRYFSVLFAPADKRPLLEALYAFEATVADAVRSTAHEAAHSKLHWWRGELDRWLGGKPQHPITATLAPVAVSCAQDASLLHEALTAADMDLAHMTYANRRELDAYLFRAAGSLQTVAACLLAGDRALSSGEREFARRFGSALRQVEMLRDLGRDLRGGRLYVPLSEMEARGIDPSRLSDSLDRPEVADLLNDWAQAMQTDLASLPATLTGAERRAQRPLLVLAALHEKLLVRLRAENPAKRSDVQVSPMQRLWTAWRSAVRHS